MLLIRLIFISFVCLLLSIPNSNRNNHAPSTSPGFDFLFFSDSGIKLKQLSEGQAGEGWIFYYAPGSTYELPSLVVNLVKKDSSSPAVADVYESPLGLNHVPIRVEDDTVIFERSLEPAIKMIAPDGWWLKNGITNYNLVVQIFGPIYAMWGGGYERESGPQGWTALIEPEELGVQIRIGDNNRDGIPDWELRSLVPEFPGRGDYRSNYAERKCDTPTIVDHGVSPLWPFIATEVSYEQPPGQFRPPIVVDWRAGKITHFSELVTVRNQNCSYTLYTINPLAINKFNKVNFEAPIAAYDLSGQGNGYPNLILRTERYPAGDRWFNQSSRDFETIRYSWRNSIGDRRWDYKVEVAGFHPFESQTYIAGGLLMVDTPTYEELPQWVIKHKWSVVTFVDTQGSPEHSSEGIYAWSPRQLSDEYLRGETEFPDPDAFSKIQVGWRGEYQFTKELAPRLYVSPIDNNLHLLGAEAGIQNLRNSMILRYRNLNNDLYIDSWTREVFKGKFSGESSKSPNWETQEAIYAVDCYLIFAGDGKVDILQSEIPTAILEIDPPTDHSTWLSFQDQVESITKQEKDPFNLASWLGELPGEKFNISGASISGLRVLQNSFQFVLELQPDYQITSTNELLPLKDLSAGKYLVRHEGGFSIEPITRAQLILDIDFPRDGLLIGNPALQKIVLDNRGLESLPKLDLIVSAQFGEEVTEITRHSVDALGGELQEFQFSWQPIKAGTWKLNARLLNTDGQILVSNQQEIEIQPRDARGSEVLLVSIKSPSQIYLLGLFLLTCIAIISFSLGSIELR